MGALERHGDSKGLSKGPARESEEFLEPWEKAGRKSDDFGGSRGGGAFYQGGRARLWVSDTLAPLGRVPACTGAHFRHLLILLSPVGKGFLKENPGFPEGLPEKKREFEQEQEQRGTTRQQCLQHGGGL